MYSDFCKNGSNQKRIRLLACFSSLFVNLMWFTKLQLKMYFHQKWLSWNLRFSPLKQTPVPGELHLLDGGMFFSSHHESSTATILLRSQQYQTVRNFPLSGTCSSVPPPATSYRSLLFLGGSVFHWAHSVQPLQSRYAWNFMNLTNYWHLAASSTQTYFSLWELP